MQREEVAVGDVSHSMLIDQENIVCMFPVPTGRAPDSNQVPKKESEIPCSWSTQARGPRQGKPGPLPPARS
jgi:hypothetical protein